VQVKLDQMVYGIGGEELDHHGHYGTNGQLQVVFDSIAQAPFQ
jgi:hypothetical protein